MPSNAEKLKTLCDEVLTGFDMTTPYAYNGRAQFGTFQLPFEVLNHAPGLHFNDTPLRSKWIAVPPVAKLNRQRLRLRHHVVTDPNFIPPTSSRPTVPRSRGVKLRDVATIMKEKEETKGMSEEQLRRYRESKQRQPSAKQVPKTMQRPAVDPVQDILNDIQAASAPRPLPHPMRHPKNSSDSSSSSSNSTPSRVVNNSRVAPAVVKKTISKSVPTKQRKPINFPDLLVTKAHLLDSDDVVETRKIAGLKRLAARDERHDNVVTKRPRLLLHLKLPINDEKRKKKISTKPKTKVKTEPNFVPSIKSTKMENKPKAKHNEPKIKTEPVAEKRPAAAPKESPPKKPTNQEFLKGIRIPKRKTETTELEEGETISPSPSPREPPLKPERRAISKDSKRSSRSEDDRRRGRVRDERRRSEDSVPEKRHRRDSRQSSTRRKSRSPPPPLPLPLAPPPPPPPPSKSSRTKRARSRSPASRSPRPRSRSSTRRSPERRPSNPPHPSSATTTTTTTTTTISKKAEPPKQPPPALAPPAPPASSALTAASVPVPVYKNATSADSETEEQCRMYSLMFRKLATAYKHRGDIPLKTKKDDTIGLVDHIQGILNYVLAFYYQDKHGKVDFWYWESLYPFFNFVIRQLQSSRETQLYALCSRIMGMVRYYQFARRESQARKQLDPLISEKPEGTIDAQVVNTLKSARSAFVDYEEASKLFKDADRYLNQEQFKEQFPQTYRAAVDKGEYGPGIVIGGEAGVTIEPRYPFVPFAKLHHAAIVAKCVLHEYLQQKSLAYTPISDTDEFM